MVIGTATRPAATKSTAVSVSSCPISRLRLAPIASRVAISRRRVEARASSIPATLLQAIARSAPVRAKSAARKSRKGVRIGPGTRLVGSSAAVCRWLASGVAALYCVIRVSSSACASVRLRPGASRPTPTCHTPRTAVSRFALGSPRASATMAIGSHTSVPASVTPSKPGSATPTTAKSRLFRRNGRSSTRGSAPSRRVQKRWVSTTTGRAPGTTSSSSRKKRPRAARVPSTEKKLADTSVPKTRSLEPATVRLIGRPPKSTAAMPLKVVACWRRYSKAGWVMLSKPLPLVPRPMSTTRPGSATPADGASSASAMLKIVLLAASPAASDTTAVTTKIGLRPSSRTAWRRSVARFTLHTTGGLRGLFRVG